MSQKKSKSDLGKLSEGIVSWVTTAGKLSSNIKFRKDLTLSLARETAKIHNSSQLLTAPINQAISVKQSGKKWVLSIKSSALSEKQARVSRKIFAKNIAQIASQISPFATTTELMRFLLEYLKNLKLNVGTYRGWFFLIELFTENILSAELAKSTRKYLKKDSFAKINLPGFSGFALKHLPGNCLSASSDKPIFAGEFKESHWEKLLNSLKIKSSDFPQKGALKIPTKLDLGKNSLDIIVRITPACCGFLSNLPGFTSRLLNGFVISHKLLSVGVATPTKLAIFENCSIADKNCSVEISLAEESIWMQKFLTANLQNSACDVEKSRIVNSCLTALGKTLARLHRNRFIHKNFRSDNIHVLNAPGFTKPIIVIKGVELMKRARILTEQRRLIGLMKLSVSLLLCPGVSHSGRLRMLSGYMRQHPPTELDFKQYWRLLEKWSDSEIRRQMKQLKSNTSRSAS